MPRLSLNAKVGLVQSTRGSKTSALTRLSMHTSDLLRHELIKGLTTQRHENTTDGALNLWKLMAAELILIIGDGGFDSLYARSVFLSQSTYPWLASGSGPVQTDQRFADLEKSLKEKPATLAREANCLLLITFTNILASMIGERLTTRILNSAWDLDTHDTADKEVKNA